MALALGPSFTHEAAALCTHLPGAQLSSDQYQLWDILEPIASHVSIQPNPSADQLNPRKPKAKAIQLELSTAPGYASTSPGVPQPQQWLSAFLYKTGPGNQSY